MIAASMLVGVLLNHTALAALNPALIDSARNGDLNAIQTAVKQGVNINDTDDNGYSLLILSIYHNQNNIAAYLLAHGANPNQTDNHGRTALMGAAFNGDLNAAAVLLQDPRTQINLQNDVGQTAAMFAALFGHKEFLQFLSEKGADLQIADKKGNTAASLAAAQGNQDLADWISSQKKMPKS